MPLREEVVYLLDRARTMRKIAAAFSAPIAPDLIEMAKQLEARAQALQNEPPPNAPPMRRPPMLRLADGGC